MVTNPPVEQEPTCDIGQQVRCGRKAVGMIAVAQTHENAWSVNVREGGVVFVCTYHWSIPPSRWQTPPKED